MYRFGPGTGGLPGDDAPSLKDHAQGADRGEPENPTLTDLCGFFLLFFHFYPHFRIFDHEKSTTAFLHIIRFALFIQKSKEIHAFYLTWVSLQRQSYSDSLYLASGLLR